MRAKKHLAKHFARLTFRSRSKSRCEEIRGCTHSSRRKARHVNRELAALKRMLRLAVEDKLIRVPIPKIEKLPENNVRTNFVQTRHIMLCSPSFPNTRRCFGVLRPGSASVKASCSRSGSNGYSRIGTRRSRTSKYLDSMIRAGV
jgi:hypothetical protein